ncbi:MAG: hypothetical protein AAGA89_06030 [Pseudomonadota bacterium]
MSETPLNLYRRGRKSLVALICMFAVTGCVTFTDSNGSLGFMPAWSQPVTAQQSVAISQSGLITASAATFIVKFRNEPVLEQVCRNFRRDEAGTRKAFQAWAAQHPQLKGLQLVRASYSGDIILALPANDPEGRTARDVIAALESLPNVAYAEIDSMASASAGN